MWTFTVFAPLLNRGLTTRCPLMRPVFQAEGKWTLLLGLALVCFTSSMPSTLPALFYTPVRYSALSIAFNVSVSLFGGTTPLVTAWLVERTGDPLVPAYYLMGAAVIGLRRRRQAGATGELVVSRGWWTRSATQDTAFCLYSADPLGPGGDKH